jgi:hypothetical protein
MKVKLMRTSWWPLACCALLLLGCSKAADPKPAATDPTPNSGASAKPKLSEPELVVQRFLDTLRRGGGGGNPAGLLTAKAQAVLEKLGQTPQPIGTPDASFEITRSMAYPDDKNVVLVHCNWTEPSAEGRNTYEVVWVTRREGDQWRIAEMAISLDANKPEETIAFNFEDEADVLAAGEVGSGNGSSSISASGDSQNLQVGGAASGTQQATTLPPAAPKTGRR